MLKRPWLFIVLVAMALAGLFSQTASHEPFEETLVRLEVERALPALEPTFQEESAEINAVFLHGCRAAYQLLPRSRRDDAARSALDRSALSASQPLVGR